MLSFKNQTKQARVSSILTSAVCLVPFALSSVCGGPAPEKAPPSAAGTADPPEILTAKWRAKHETDYRRDWVTIAGLYPFKQGNNTAGSAPKNDIVLPESTPASLGRFVLNGERVRFEPSPPSPGFGEPRGAPVLLRDKPVTGPIDLKDDSTSGADELIVGSVRLVVHVSGKERALRVRDPNGKLAREF